MPTLAYLDTGKYKLEMPAWADVCTEVNMTRAIRMRANESHWVLEPGHTVIRKSDNVTIPGIHPAVVYWRDGRGQGHKRFYETWSGSRFRHILA